MIDEAELVATGRFNDLGEEYFFLRENEKLAYINRNGTWLRTRFDGTASRSRTSNYKESDPYRQVWDDPKEHEQFLVDQAKKGALFIPSWEEKSFRYKSVARSLLYSARKKRASGYVTEAHGYFEEALKYRRLAQHAASEHVRALRLSR